MIQRVSILPAASDSFASSRIRAYSLQRALVRRGIVATLGYWPEAQVIVFQKNLNWRRLQQARRARSQGRFIVYDLDDVNDAALKPKAYFKQMLKIAHLVTTDTVGHREMIQALNAPNVAVVPDTIDYYPDGPARRPLSRSARLRVLWFGASENLRLLKPYADALLNAPEIELVVITKGVEQLRSLHPHMSFIEWSRDNFISSLQSCDVACLMHDGNENDRAKSNNKLITSICWGVPAIASSTPDYYRTLVEAGVQWAAFSTPTEMLDAALRFRNHEVEIQYLDAAQGPIWDRYSPAAVAEEFLNVVQAQFASHPDTEVTRISIDVRLWRVRESLGNGIKDVPRQFQRAKRLLKRLVTMTGLARPAGENHSRDYVRCWVSPEGAEYRRTVFDRQRRGGLKPLDANPTIDEIKDALRSHSPTSVLEIGCGWGRILEQLSSEFNIEGCDVSDEMLAKCPDGLRTHRVDIAEAGNQFSLRNRDRWDVTFTRGVMLYLMEDTHAMTHALNNMMLLTKKKILIWEWPEVCDRIRQITSSSKFEFHPIQYLDE